MSVRFYASRFLPLSMSALFSALILAGCGSIPGSQISSWSFVDRNGNSTSKVSFASLGTDEYSLASGSNDAVFSEKLCRVKIDEQCGFVDSAGQYVIKPQFKNAGQFHEGLACVADESDKIGYVDHSGAYVIPPKFGHEENYPSGMERLEFNDGLAAATYGGKFGFIDHKGKWVVKHAYKACVPFANGVAQAAKDDSDHKSTMSVDCLDKTGKILCSLNVDRDYFHRSPYKSSFAENGLALCLKSVSTDGRFDLFCDKKGKQVLGPFWRAEPFSEGLAAVVDKPEAQHLYGYIDEHGVFAIAPKFSNAGQFHDGLASVSVRTAGASAAKFGFIDKTGKFVVEPTYDNANDFSNGLALVWQGQKCGYIDKTGKVAIPFKYSAGKAFSDDVAVVTDGRTPLLNLVSLKALPGFPQSFSLSKYPNAALGIAMNAEINLGQSQKSLQLMLVSYDSLDNIEKYYTSELRALGYVPQTMEELKKKNVNFKVSVSGVKDPFAKENYRFMAGENDREFMMVSLVKEDSTVTIYLDAVAK